MKSFLAKLKGDKKNKSTTTTPSTPTKPTPAPATSAPAPTTNTTTASAAFIADMTEKSESFFKAIEARRTYYALKPETTLTDAQLQSIVERAVKHTPTSFNMQHTRAVLVTKDVKNKVWDTIKEIKTKDETGEWHGGVTDTHTHEHTYPSLRSPSTSSFSSSSSYYHLPRSPSIPATRVPCSSLEPR